MKKIIALMIVFSFVACSDNPKENTNSKVTKDGEVVSFKSTELNQGDEAYKIDIKNGQVLWVGSKPTGKHNGIIGLKKGEIILNEGKLVGGNVVIDMNSINDISQTGEYKVKLENHLKSPDFFDVGVFPEAIFVISKVVETKSAKDGFTNSIYGDLTIKNITKQISFMANVEKRGDFIAISAAPFKIDRTDFGVKYKSKKFFSALKDKIIDDDITISSML